jgi:predicted nucleotidyltransferase
MLTTQQKDVIKETLKSYDPALIGIFGSYARNEQTESSDLDLLIDLQKQINLLDLIGLEQQLTDLLGIKVDLVTMRSLNEQLKSYIQRDLIRIL